MNQLKQNKFSAMDLKDFRDGILLYCIYYLKVLANTQHETNFLELQSSSDEKLNQFNDLFEQFKSKITPRKEVYSTSFSLSDVNTLTSTTGTQEDRNDLQSQKRTLKRLWKDREFFSLLSSMWNHPFIQNSFNDRNKKKIPAPLLGENIEYFMNGRVEKLVDFNELNMNDILRLKTISTEKVPSFDFSHFALDRSGRSKFQNFTIVESPGWKEKRELAIPFCSRSDLNTIIFMVPLSEIDLVCFEDLVSPNRDPNGLSNKNRLLDSLHYFEDTFSKKVLSKQKNSNLKKVLLFTKVDVFIEKVQRGDVKKALETYFTDFNGDPTNPKHVFDYIVRRFQTLQQRHSIDYMKYYYGASDNQETYSSSIVMHTVNLLNNEEVKEVINCIIMNVKEPYTSPLLSGVNKANLFQSRLVYKQQFMNFTDIKVNCLDSYCDVDYL